MSKKDQNFYVWTMAECIKDTYENWGIDMMSMYSHIRKDFPNATKAIHKIYTDFRGKQNCYKAEALTFENPQYVYESIANLIPNDKELLFDLNTEEQQKQYSDLNLCSWEKYVEINRMDLIMAVLLFTEEFIFQPITSKNVSYKDTELVVDGTFVTLKISKYKAATHIKIVIKDVILLKYVVLN